LEILDIFNSKLIKKFIKRFFGILALYVVLSFVFAAIILFFKKDIGCIEFILICILVWVPLLIIILFGFLIVGGLFGKRLREFLKLIIDELLTRLEKDVADKHKHSREEKRVEVTRDYITIVKEDIRYNSGKNVVTLLKQLGGEASKLLLELEDDDDNSKKAESEDKNDDINKAGSGDKGDRPERVE